jgi:hypothetical protein
VLLLFGHRGPPSWIPDTSSAGLKSRPPTAEPSQQGPFFSSQALCQVSSKSLSSGLQLQLPRHCQRLVGASRIELGKSGVWRGKHSLACCSTLPLSAPTVVILGTDDTRPLPGRVMARMIQCKVWGLWSRSSILLCRVVRSAGDSEGLEKGPGMGMITTDRCGLGER